MYEVRTVPYLYLDFLLPFPATLQRLLPPRSVGEVSFTPASHVLCAFHYHERGEICHGHKMARRNHCVRSICRESSVTAKAVRTSGAVSHLVALVVLGLRREIAEGVSIASGASRESRN